MPVCLYVAPSPIRVLPNGGGQGGGLQENIHDIPVSSEYRPGGECLFSADKRFVLNAKAQDYAMLENVVIPKPVCAFWREINDLPFRSCGL